MPIRGCYGLVVVHAQNIRDYMGLEKFKDYRKRIDKMSMDFVIVAAPTIAHAENVKYVIENGLHVFVERV